MVATFRRMESAWWRFREWIEELPGQARLALVVMVVTPIIVIGIVATSTARSSPNGSGDGCEAAWDSASEVSPLADTQQTYAATLTACRSLDEWSEQNTFHRSPVGEGYIPVDNLCRRLDITSAVCSEARTEASAYTPQHDDTAFSATTTCADLKGMGTAGERLDVIRPLLRHHLDRQPTTLEEFDFGSDIEGVCDYSNSANIADIGDRLFQADPAKYGG